jgi:hypothetical protein
MKQQLARDWILARPGATQGQGAGADNYAYALAINLMWAWDLTADEALPVMREWGEVPSNVDRYGGYYPWR